MPTYRLTIEYEGTRYSGWQAQGNTQKTVQGHLIRAASEAFGEADLGGAGRTDAGVHASGQVAHLRIRKAIDPQQIARSLNDNLPHDIHVLAASRAGDGFHARHDAESRIYLYQISRRRAAFAKPFVWWIKDALDVSTMRSAAELVAGRHDFTAFADRRMSDEDSRIVVVESCEVGEAGDLILVRIAASHFLWKMVRKLIAALVEVGRGTLTVERFAQMVTGEGEHFSPAAPPSGLFLEAVIYPGEAYDRPLGPIVPVVTQIPRRKQR
jgi:tRNA pseudouridine38-40 synthase